jgi:carbamoyltransferase
MRLWGISALSHDASLAVIENGEILFAGHSERYSRKKNDPELDHGMLEEALAFGVPDAVAWYERPYLKKLRHIRAGQLTDALHRADLPRNYLRSLRMPFPIPDILYADHHHSHAAAAFATSGFTDAAVLVGDAIGEFRTFTIGQFNTYGEFDVLHKRNYPHSLGLLYSAFTRRCGFRPNEDEYIIMGLAAFGNPLYKDAIYEELLEIVGPSFRLKMNPHRGIGDWLPTASKADLAASIQAVTEEVLLNAARWARDHTESRNLILMGGLALNCVANTKIAQLGLFDKIWIFPNPGDAGSSIGAAAAVTGARLRWDGPYLGTRIDGDYPVDELVDTLLDEGIVGVASGRAEFGPRALGNRSLLADPRPLDMRDRVNTVKGREPFRPFAPVIRAELARKFFDLPIDVSPYMQYTSRLKEPGGYPAIVHHDGTSRVQTVTVTEHPKLYELLLRWEAKTGCPMLLNTSLNSRGEPLVNTKEHADEFAVRNNMRVL